MRSPVLGNDAFAYHCFVDPPLLPLLENAWCVSSIVVNQSMSLGWIIEIALMTPSVNQSTTTMKDISIAVIEKINTKTHLRISPGCSFAIPMFTSIDLARSFQS